MSKNNGIFKEGLFSIFNKSGIMQPITPVGFERGTVLYNDYYESRWIALGTSADYQDNFIKSDGTAFRAIGSDYNDSLSPLASYEILEKEKWSSEAVTGLEAQYKAHCADTAEKRRLHDLKFADDSAKGHAKMLSLMPAGSVALILGILKVDQSDSQTDYFNHTTGRIVLLGFSSHTRNDFKEFRRFAKNCPETAFLATTDAKNEHRENYTGGHGCYLSEGWHSGWEIVKKRLTWSGSSEFVWFADDSNIFVASPEPVKPATAKVAVWTDSTDDPDPFVKPSPSGLQLIRYSEKSFAIIGETKAVKDQLKGLGCKFNGALTINGNKQAGWLVWPNLVKRVSDVLNLQIPA